MWQQDKIYQLIDYYSENPHLWNPNHSDYRNKSLKKAAYLEIGSKLGCDSSDIPLKWMYLKNTFVKEKKKTEGSKGVYKSRWDNYERLSFLNIVLQSEKIPIENPIKIINYCRSCMREDQKLIDVFSTSIGEGSPIRLSDIFYLMTKIKITEEDKLPTKICEKCKGFIVEFIKFKEKASLVQDNLNDLLESVQDKNEVFTIAKKAINLEESIESITKKKRLIKSHKCSQCNKSFNDKSNLLKHIKMIHENLRSFLCDLCGKGFNSEALMKSHRMIHTGEKPFICKYCDKPFRLLSGLSVHILAKHKEKKTKCPDCGKSFTQKCVMETHRRVHTGERPFACTECDKKYTKKLALEHHFKVVHRGFKYVCKYCSKELSAPSHLSRHLKIHTNDKPNKCNFCTQEFSRSDYLKKHIAKDHKTETISELN